MKKQILAQLKKYPFLFNLVVNSYYYFNIHHAKTLLFGTKVNEDYWANRQIKGDKSNDWDAKDDWVKGYWESRDHPHRKYFIDAISRYDFKSALEIGCNCGPNLYLLANKNKDADITGIDINEAVIEKGKEWMSKDSIDNVTLFVSKADSLEKYPDNSFDVVFTDAVLLYIGPDKIKDIAKHMYRISKKAIILMEWNDFNSKERNDLGRYYKSFWLRNYADLFSEFVPRDRIHITKINKDIWPEENWSEVGAIIEVVKETSGIDRNVNNCKK